MPESDQQLLKQMLMSWLQQQVSKTAFLKTTVIIIM